MKRLLYCVVAWGVLVGFTGSAKAQYIFTTLDVPGSTDTFASGINDGGEIVGYYTDFLGMSHGFLATPVP